MPTGTARAALDSVHTGAEGPPIPRLSSARMYHRFFSLLTHFYRDLERKGLARPYEENAIIVGLTMAQWFVPAFALIKLLGLAIKHLAVAEPTQRTLGVTAFIVGVALFFLAYYRNRRRYKGKTRAVHRIAYSSRGTRAGVCGLGMIVAANALSIGVIRYCNEMMATLH